MTSTMSLPGDDENIRDSIDDAIRAGSITDDQVTRMHQLLDEHPGRYTWEQIEADSRRG